MSAYRVSERVALALARDAGLRSSITITGHRDLNVPDQPRRIYSRHVAPNTRRMVNPGTPYEYELRHDDAFVPDVLAEVSTRLGIRIETGELMSTPYARRGDSADPGDGDGDYMECECGNDPTTGGFYASTSAGETMHDDGGNPLDGWDNEHVRCADCGAVYSAVEVDHAPPGALVAAVAVRPPARA